LVYYWRTYKIYIVIILSILLIICGITYKSTVYDTQVVLDEKESNIENKKEEPVEEEIVSQLITVYVCGSVKAPSNITLSKDSRIEDAIRLAGGATDKADLNAINMAQKLADADMIYVPEKGEEIKSEEKSTTGVVSPKTKGKININNATATDLDGLPGVGPSIANKIIEYRKSKGNFKSIEDLNNVSGIGDKKYDDIKGLITVN